MAYTSPGGLAGRSVVRNWSTENFLSLIKFLHSISDSHHWVSPWVQ